MADTLGAGAAREVATGRLRLGVKLEVGWVEWSTTPLAEKKTGGEKNERKAVKVHAEERKNPL